MLNIITNFLKRKPRREYLYDEFKPRKSSAVIWLQRLIILLLLGVLVIFLMMLGNQARASTNDDIRSYDVVNINSVSEGSLLIKTDQAGQFKKIPLLKTDVEMNVSGMIARSHIKQHFENTSNDWIEAVYVFPLPETAAVDHLRMHIGERIIEGKIKEKQVAKRIYEKAKREGKKTALIEQQRANIFTNSVANIGPGESIVVEIEYQQTLTYDQGNFSLRFPMAITPRYIPGKPVEEAFSISDSGWAKNTLQVSDASFITPPVYTGLNKINPVSINIHLNAGFPLQKIHSRYHTINQQALPDNTVDISLSNESTPSDRDFELVWTPLATHAPKAAVFNQQLNNENFQLLMILPPDTNTFNGQALAREVSFVIDTSGSMHGISIEQARRSLLMALDRLRLHDKFNIIQFNSSTDQLFSQSKTASFDNVLIAKRYVNNLAAGGGTEMVPALNLALNQSHDDNFVRQIIFLTDGSVGNETELFDIIHNKLGQSRLFTIGIGSAPNSYFMRKAAQFGRGTFTYISDVNEVDEKMSALFSKLENPIMTNLKLDIDKDISAEIWPQRISDLYQGEPVILAVKTDKPLTEVTIRGKRAFAPWSATLILNSGESSEGIGTFWARGKISSLMDSLHEGADKNKVRDEVIVTALKHHMVSKYTSLVAVDVSPARPLQSNLKKQAMPVNLPHGQNHQKIFGRLPQTATSSEIQILFGCILLLLALLSQMIHWPPFSNKNIRVKG